MDHAACPVVWTQGLFLQPQHFQQQTRHVEHLVDRRTRAAHPHAWGFTELVLDDALLALGRVGIVRASGVLPDGTPFAFPADGPGPAPLEVPADARDETVQLVLPLARGGTTEVDFGGDAATVHRFQVIDAELRDQTNAVDDPEPVQLAALNLGLRRERDPAADGFARLGVARVVERRADGQVVLDRGYVPPQTRIDATGQLSAHATLLHGLVRQRAAVLAGQMGQPGHGVSEVADLLTLLVLNRAEPILRQHAGGPHVHPEDFHAACLQLAGELSTFSAEPRLAPEFPLYRHTELGPTFLPVVAALRRLLGAVRERHVLRIELTERAHGVRTGVFADPELARSSNLVLAVHAQMPSEPLRQRFPQQSKLGPVDRIRDLVNLALPGVELRLLPTAPRQLPFHAGFHYFELDRGGELWKQIERQGSLALFVGGDFPGLELELWAIRQ